MVRLGDVCTVVSGTTPKSTQPEYWDGDLNWVTPAELTDESDVIYESQRKITSQAVADSSLKSFPAGTVLLSSRAPIGKVAIAGTEMYCNQGFKNLICSDKIYNRYLYHFLKNNTDYLNSLGRGATFKEISKGIVENIEIPLPSLDDQRKIAAVLDKVSDLIAKRRQQLDKLDEMVKARFVEMFKDASTNTRQLSEIAQITGGLTKNSKRASLKLQFPYLRVANVFFNRLELKEVPKIGVTENEIEKTLLQKGDLLFVEGNGSIDQIGRVAIWDDSIKPCLHQNHLIKVRFNFEKVNPSYALFYFMSESGRMQITSKSVSTSGLNTLSVKKIESLNLPVPPIDLQNQFAAFVEQTEKIKTTISHSLEKLETLKKALMQDYFG